MTNEITLGGYSLDTLKTMKAAIQQDANKFVAENLAEAVKIISEIVAGKEEENEELDYAGMSNRAEELLESVSLVSKLSDVAYYLDYHTDWGYSDEQPLSSQLEEHYDDAFDGLVGVLEDMEWQSRNWHQSTC